VAEAKMAEEKQNTDSQEMIEQNLPEEDISIDINALMDEEPTEAALLQVEINDLKDRLMRALAEAENTRKRGERDRRDAEIYGGSKLARDMLSVHDNLKRALGTVDDAQRETSKALIEGIELTARELISTFAKHKILTVAPEIGDKFDPKIHQAMFEAPIPDVPGGHIIQVLGEGFIIGDRLLRPAQVGVSSTPVSATSKPVPAEEE
jgi:molecular chaperone GrpE